MYLKEGFDDEFGNGNWSEPTRTVASKMSLSVVALASFIVEYDSTGEHDKGDCTVVSSLGSNISFPLLGHLLMQRKEESILLAQV